ncbi:NAD(P)H-binding protein [Streptomyces sp. NPDC048577]|uniref:SDR family oxidoreductase n=1 Tax=Streptomyces sp. NPDC048577 TaxID=3157209 RepID=UPI003438A024
MTTILVTGGTGTLGRPVCDRLRADGHEVRVLSRHSPPYAVDLRRGGPLVDRAVRGADAIVHCTNILRGDEAAARQLIEAAHRTGGRPHLVYISIVGVDRVPLGYYRAKYAVERMVRQSGLGWTIVRTTRFHDLVLRLLEALARPPVMMLPKALRDQPLEVTEAAARLAELAAGGPAGRVADMGGPEILGFTDLAVAYLEAAGRTRRLVETPLPGRVYRDLRLGAHLAPESAVGRVTFAEFLARRFANPTAAGS